MSTGNVQGTRASAKDDALLKAATERLCEWLEIHARKSYYRYAIWDCLDTSTLMQRNKKFNPNYQSSFMEHRAKASIVPDGCTIVRINELTNEWEPIIISEMKAQGVKKLNKGNAIERTFKNYNFIERVVCYPDKIFPYIVFCHGLCFGDEFILDKLRFGSASELNEIHIEKMEGGTFFTKIDEWSEDELFEKLLNVAQQVLKKIDSPKKNFWKNIFGKLR